MRIVRRILIVLPIAVLLAGTASFAGEPGDRRGGGEPDLPGHPRRHQRPYRPGAGPGATGDATGTGSMARGAAGRDVQATVEAYMLSRMKEEVGLTPDQQSRLFPIIRDSERQRNAAGQEKRDLTDQLRVLADEPTTQDSALRSRLARLHALDVEEDSRRENLIARLVEILDVRQQAKMVVFLDRFPSEMRDRLRAVRQPRGQGPASAEPDAPARDPATPDN